jgi:hypothetical protein
VEERLDLILDPLPLTNRVGVQECAEASGYVHAHATLPRPGLFHADTPVPRYSDTFFRRPGSIRFGEHRPSLAGLTRKDAGARLAGLQFFIKGQAADGDFKVVLDLFLEGGVAGPMG